MTAADARRFCAAFGLDAEPERELLGGYSNESWLARTAGDERVVVRRYGRLNVTRNALFYEHAVMRHAQAGGALVRAPLAAPDGDSLLATGGAFVAVLPYVPGASGDRALAGDAARALAGFHRAMHDFRALRPRATRTLGTLAWLRDRFVHFASDPSLARALDWNAAIVAVAGATARVAPAVRGLPLCVVHGDAHPDNVVGEKAAVRALIDFDFTHETERAYDVATAADAYARDGDHAELDLARFTAFVRAYDAELPLAPDEWTVLLDLAIRRAAMLVWYVVTRHGLRARGDVGAAPAYVRRLNELSALAHGVTDLRAVS